MNNLIKINNRDLEIKEFQNQRIVTFKDIDYLHERVEGTAKRNFAENKDKLIEGEDYFNLTADQRYEIRTLEIPNRGITVLTESGYLMLVKSLNDDLAWKVQRQLVDTYFRAKSLVNSMDGLSPQLQLLINMELKQKEIEMAITETKQEVQDIRDTMVLDHDSWRKECNTLINKIAKQRGGTGEAYKGVREEVYNLVEQRAGAKLKTRIVNKQDRMRREGTSESKVRQVSQVDVIAEDKRLKEIYIAVVKEMAIKYGA